MGWRKVLRKLLSAQLDRSDEPVGNTVFTRMRNQGINGCLPSRLRPPFRDLVIGDDARIAFRQRNKYQDPAALDISSDASADELLHRNPESNSAADPARHKRDPHGRNTKDREKNDKYDDLHGQDPQDRHCGEDHEQPRRHERHQGRDKYRKDRCMRGYVREHADDLSRGLFFGRPDRPRDALVVFGLKGHPQLPDAPPPPDQRPPPEKPPPPPPPPE